MKDMENDRMEKRKAIKFESFKELKRFLILFGVWRADSCVKESVLCIIKNCVSLSFLFSLFVTSAWFVIFSAQSAREITESSYFALFSLQCTAWYLTLIWHRNSYAAIFNELDIKIEQSNYKLHYLETISKMNVSHNLFPFHLRQLL